MFINGQNKFKLARDSAVNIICYCVIIVIHSQLLIYINNINKCLSLNREVLD